MLKRAIVTGVFCLALLPVLAAAAPDAPPNNLHVAIAQPIGAAGAPLLSSSSSPRLFESGILVLVGSGLMALGAVVRRATRVQ